MDLKFRDLPEVETNKASTLLKIYLNKVVRLIH